jgi:hypothetical protein
MTIVNVMTRPICASFVYICVVLSQAFHGSPHTPVATRILPAQARRGYAPAPLPCRSDRLHQRGDALIRRIDRNSQIDTQPISEQSLMLSPILDGELDQFRLSFDIELAFHVEPVGLHRSHGQTIPLCNLLT